MYIDIGVHKNCQMVQSLNSGMFDLHGSTRAEDGLVKFIFYIRVTCTVAAAMSSGYGHPGVGVSF